MTDDNDLQLATMEKRVIDRNKMERLKMTRIRRLHFLVVNLKENVKIVVQSGKKQRISNQNQTKMPVIIAEITKIFRNMQVMALIVLIIVVQVI
jgi:hypothetical protein